MIRPKIGPAGAFLLVFLVTLLLALTGCGSTDDPAAVYAPDKGEPGITAETPTEAPDETQTETPADQLTEAPTEAGDSNRRDYRTVLKGGGEDVVTLMVYLCGSDLESEAGAATIDLFEMMTPEISENLNIVVETGGAEKWATDYMDPDVNQRWQVVHEDLLPLESIEAKNMSEGSTLRDFITYSAEHFPADRYILVLWDHGGGTVDGYAYDERFDNPGMMSLSELDTALTESGVEFDLIGFDSCLMSTAETAFMLEQHADYMVASQRVEPGSGWHYTPWIEALSRNTSLPTAELGTLIVDSYIQGIGDGYGSRELTLSVTDLTYIPGLFEALYSFFSEAQTDLVDGDMFVTASQTLGGSRAMQSKHDLVDLAFLIEQMGGQEELLDKLSQCVVYNRATIENHNGLCMYVPYTELDEVGEALDICAQVGIGEDYRKFIGTFANIMLGGQAYSGGGTGNPISGDEFDLNALMSLATWADEDEWVNLEGFFADNSYDDSLLPIEELDGEFVLTMSDEEWELMTYADLMVFLDDGEGYIDLGTDCRYEFDGTNLYIRFDNTWVALDGQLVCYYNTDYVVEDDYWYSCGVVPILYEDEDAELVLVWDDENPEGYVAGWRYTTVGSGSQRGLFELQDGMYFDFLCDYYTYDHEYDDQYLFGGMTVDGPVTVSYEDVGEADCLVYYALYDIFQNTYWTEPVIFSLDY